MEKTIMKPFIRLAAPLLLVTAASQGQSQMPGFELQPLYLIFFSSLQSSSSAE